MKFVYILITSLIYEATCDVVEDHTSSATDLLKQLSYKYKNTYVVYGKGRQKERDLPVCDSGEACNFAHRRFWLTPITERLCRCPKGECHLNYTSLNDLNTQHITNRGQLKYCKSISDWINICGEDEVSLTVDHIMKENTRSKYTETRSVSTCHCPWPRQFKLNTTQDNQDTTKMIYTCSTLDKCTTDEICGAIRSDTLETYYTCSCPDGHLCLFPWGQPPEETNQLHYKGPAYVARCTLTSPNDY